MLLAVAAAGKNEESDYNDPDNVAVVKKIAKAVVHKYFLLKIMRGGISLPRYHIMPSGVEV